MPRITKEPEERRQEILDTSMRLFYEKGYEKTSITDIAKAMHVAQGLCYRYFASKEEIFDTALEQYAESLAAQMTKGMKDKEVPLAQLIREMPNTSADVHESLRENVARGKRGFGQGSEEGRNCM